MVQTSQSSPDLVWRIIARNNAFLKKQRFGRGKEGFKLSSEPLNVTARSSFKCSGIAGQTAVGVQLGEKGVTVSVSGKEARDVPVKRSKRVGGKIARAGRKDLRTHINARTQRLRRLTTRKSRKSWSE
eukprot:TRINITY_DN2476_c0_g2_i2.p2 TRINITY_DN2476_c0_g2~~TRINITY_DN2476_c0_g2_i2.p2  ORF type:complete len:128 (+),score=22.93 TRINITY_DN2476_c0_g2_i2:50-433(+)